MKKLILIFTMALCMSVVFGQTAQVRLEMPATPPNIGENFFVSVYVDALDWPADQTIWAAIYGWDFDPAVLTPVSTGPPFNRYFFNLNTQNDLFSLYGVTPQSSNPFPGDVRVFFATAAAYGLDPLLATPAGYPLHLFDLQFTYNGGDIAITFDETGSKLTPVSGEAGGTLKSVLCEMSAPPGPPAGVPYTVTYINIPAGGDPGPYVWTGLGADDAWGTLDNWTVDGAVPAMAPTELDEVEIPFLGKASPYPTIFGSAATGMLTLFPGAQLNIAAMADLTTHGLFTNNGVFVIESVNTGEAGSYIDMMGMGGTGTFEFQRDITNVTPLGSEIGWHFISSPLPAGQFTSDDLYYYYVNWFDAVAQQYVSIEGDPNIPCTPAPTVMNGMMEGWSIKYDDQYGPLCTGMEDYVVNMMGSSFNTGVNSAGFLPGYNLMGNPYPSAINPDNVIWPAGLLTNTAFMWDGWGSGTGNWQLAFVGGPNNIPPAQGFFVDALAAGTFQLNGTTGATGERLHDNFQYWWKDAADYLALKATVEGLTNSDVTYIRFNDLSTTGLDKEWDANERMSGIAETPHMYTTSGSLELALNTQPSTDMVPMSFICGTAGTYTIDAIEVGTFDFVVLEDLVSGEQTNLLETAYTFDYTDVDNVRNFIVHFAPLGVGELNANSVKIWSLENNIIVNVAANVTGEIAVYNMMGQEVVRTDIEGTETQIPVSDVNTNYVVKVISDSNAVTGKVYVK